MGDTIRATWEGFLELVSNVVIPDWGALIGLIPVGLLLVILAALGRLAWGWLGFYLAQPERPAGPVNAGAEIRRRAMLIPVGGIIVLVALTVLPSRPNRVAEVGLDTVILLAGIVIALAGAALAILATEAADVAADRPRSPRSARAILRTAANRFGSLPAAYRPLPGLLVGGAMILAAFVAAGAAPSPGVLPEASIGLILLGILIGLGSAGAAIHATEQADRGERPASAPEHGPAAAAGTDQETQGSLTTRSPGAYA